MTKFITVLLAAAMLAASSADAAPAKRGLFRAKKPVADTTKVVKKPAVKPGDPKPYGQIITKDAKTSQGLVTVHVVDDKYYFEIPDSLMGRDLLVVGRVSKAPADRQKSKVGYPGDKFREDVVRFELNKNSNKVFIRSISYLEQSSDTLGMYQSVRNSNIQPIIAAFDVKAYNLIDGQRLSVIDATDYIKGSSGIFAFDDKVRKSVGVASMTADASYIDTLKVFPTNVEVRTIKTYTRSTPTSMEAAMEQRYGSPSTPLTYELNSSIILLPAELMKYRLYDPRVGYFAVRYTDFDANPQGIEYRAKITRWRLEPKDEDIEKYKRGELVEPKKPIVIYIDPATPKRWVPYLIQGVNDWQKAFEKAGFKNAIIGMEAPTDDPSWSLEDARHSAIVYKPSDIPNASGPHIHDPRTGEILETHINWYHNVMSLLRTWYQVQCGPLDPGARTMNFNDELMGELIRFVSSHEVGHTLGLRHNFGSSATVPVEKLRDKAWVEAHGHTPSIMDYARFNYVAQPEDNISRTGLFPRIGIYDDWSIEWGYRWLPQFAAGEDEIAFNNKSVIAKLKEDVRFSFGTETDPDDPRNQSEDLGDNSMTASAYGIKNLQRIMPNILEWTREADKDYEGAEYLYLNVVAQMRRYMGHVAKNVGGIYTTPRTVEEAGAVVAFVDRDRQRAAVDFLKKQLFATPVWLVSKDIEQMTEVDMLTTIGTLQNCVLSESLLTRYTLDKLTRGEAVNGSKAYTAVEFLSDLRKGVWGELSSGKTPDVYRRNLQKNYIKALAALMDRKLQGDETGVIVVLLGSPGRSTPSDAAALARGQMVELGRDIKRTATSSSGVAKMHYQNLASLIDAALEMK
ncbi:MAG: zinc-dependent metalloprotease [Rikenellaceae bacterium]|jgi:hypothetical protein|nr:zinc-dependent metalloprotease [Rikenellaceae bacterium]